MSESNGMNGVNKMNGINGTTANGTADFLRAQLQAGLFAQAGRPVPTGAPFQDDIHSQNTRWQMNTQMYPSQSNFFGSYWPGFQPGFQGPWSGMRQPSWAGYASAPNHGGYAAPWFSGAYYPPSEGYSYGAQFQPDVGGWPSRVNYAASPEAEVHYPAQQPHFMPSYWPAYQPAFNGPWGGTHQPAPGYPHHSGYAQQSFGAAQTPWSPGHVPAYGPYGFAGELYPMPRTWGRQHHSFAPFGGPVATPPASFGAPPNTFGYANAESMPAPVFGGHAGAGWPASTYASRYH